MTITLQAHIPVAPHPPTRTNPNGLHKLVTPEAGLSKLLDVYCPKWLAGDLDGCIWYHPFAKWSRVPWLNPFGVVKRTGMRLDALKNAEATLPWLVEAFDRVAECRDEIYTGSVPPMPLRMTGLERYISMDMRVWFDGASANGGTALHRDIWECHKNGKPAGSEANRKCLSLVAVESSQPSVDAGGDGRFLQIRMSYSERPDQSVPVIADADQWYRTATKRGTHWTLTNHPPKSAAWFRKGVTNAGDIALLRDCVGCGLNIKIDFGPTIAAGYYKQVLEIVRAA